MDGFINKSQQVWLMAVLAGICLILSVYGFSRDDGLTNLYWPVISDIYHLFVSVPISVERELKPAFPVNDTHMFVTFAVLSLAFSLISIFLGVRAKLSGLEPKLIAAPTVLGVTFAILTLPQLVLYAKLWY